nr:MFS transporter [Bradyrhizobium sp. CCBAU 51745]
MTDLSTSMEPVTAEMHEHSPGVAFRSLVIGLTAFLTVVDLFATQAILPSLTRHYGVTPAAMGFAVNASTFGMAISSLVVGFFSPHIDRRLGILFGLSLLAIPTSLLAIAPVITVFMILRVAQGLFMASSSP